MIFGNASWGLRETPLEKQLEITQKMGLEVLELGIANAPKDIPLEISDSELEDIKKLCQSYGVIPLCAATGNDFTNGNSDDVCKVKRVIDICQRLGVKYLRIFSGFTPLGEVTDDIRKNMADCLNEVYEYAKAADVILTVETHGGVNGYDDGVEHIHSTSSDINSLLKMIVEVPDIKFNFDPANIYAVGTKNPEEVYTKLKDKVCCAHLKDFVTLPSGHLLPSACGESDMDWRAVLSALKDFDGPALFEYENVEDIEDGLNKCYNYINNILKENN